MTREELVNSIIEYAGDDYDESDENQVSFLEWTVDDAIEEVVNEMCPYGFSTDTAHEKAIGIALSRYGATIRRIAMFHFDKQGKAHKAFMLPQRDPEHNIMLLKSYNVPELTRNAIQISTVQLKHIVLDTEAEVAHYELQ